MAERKKKVKPDTALKTYWNRNEEFADLFNALLYDGRQVIQAEKLEERDTESSVILQMDDDPAESIQAARDLFCLFGLLYDKNNKNREKEAIAYADSNNVDGSVILAIGSAGGVDVETMKKKGDVAMLYTF